MNLAQIIAQSLETLQANGWASTQTLTKIHEDAYSRDPTRLARARTETIELLKSANLPTRALTSAASRGSSAPRPEHSFEDRLEFALRYGEGFGMPPAIRGPEDWATFGIRARR